MQALTSLHFSRRKVSFDDQRSDLECRYGLIVDLTCHNEWLLFNILLSRFSYFFALLPSDCKMLPNPQLDLYAWITDNFFFNLYSMNRQAAVRNAISCCSQNSGRSDTGYSMRSIYTQPGQSSGFMRIIAGTLGPILYKVDNVGMPYRLDA